MDDKRLLCTVYRSPKREGMYLYVRKDADLAELPEALRKVFGTPALAMNLLLHAGRPLARVPVETVMTAIREQGFYLQMPPPESEPPLALARNPDDA